MTNTSVLDEEPPFPDPEDIFNNLDEDDKMIATGMVIPCDICDGNGEVRQYGSYAETDIGPCHRCRETGWIHSSLAEDWG